MAYSVKGLAKLSGVSVRTLHFYDEIGLLKPAYHGENGYRVYEQPQLLMLQQILFFKELGFTLTEVERLITAANFDKVETLKSHRAILERNIEHTHALIKTIDNTILNLEGGTEMKAKEMYLGFDKEKQAEYEQYWVENGGKRLVTESRKNTNGWKKKDYDIVGEEFERLDHALTSAIRANQKPEEQAVQEIVRQHYALIKRFYHPTKEIYTGLGQMYVENPDFRKRYDNFHPRQAQFWRDAMRIFADREW